MYAYQLDFKKYLIVQRFCSVMTLTARIDGWRFFNLLPFLPILLTYLTHLTYLTYSFILHYPPILPYVPYKRSWASAICRW